MNIGAAARVSGVSVKMIRYYEETGLIPAPERTAAGYRVYGPREVEMLRFVRRARDLGFSLKEIAELLALWRDRARASADVKAIALAHVADLERRIGDMRAMAAVLSHLARTCHGDDRPDCPILDDLARGGRPPA
ncbi:MAG: Cu(I)-responsive transcriptional regulator [Rubellimicrobium sp.]|nr:Cu(I)-responsive transcriptional regulator [Rubellimicrobium sp.]